MKRKQLRQLLFQTPLLLLLFVWQNCSDVKFTDLPSAVKAECERLDSGVCDNGGITPQDASSLNKSASFQQPEATYTSGKLDLLIVTDTSGSLDAERTAVAQGISGFIDGRFSDVRVAVMFGHTESSHSGSLFQAGDEPVVLSTDDFDLSDINQKENFQQGVFDKLTQVLNEPVSDGGEAVLYSLKKSTSGEHLTQIRNQGFYREDAALAIIYVSDENDICSRGHAPEGITHVYDGDKYEIPAYNNYCVDENGLRTVSPTSVLSSLRDIKGSQPIIIGGVMYLNPDLTPQGGENEVSYGLIENIGLNNGIDEAVVHQSTSISQWIVELAPEVANEDIPAKIISGLNFIGQRTQQEIQLRTNFTLQLSAGEIYIPNSALVYVDGQPVVSQSHSSVDGQYVTVTISANDAGEALSNIKIDYSVAIPSAQEVNVSSNTP